MDKTNKSEISSYVLLFRVLSNAIRFRIILSLIACKKSVGEICEETGVEQARASRELHCLAVCGFVDSARDGKRVIYSLNRETVLPILKAAEGHARKFGNRMGACDMISEAKKMMVEYAKS